MTARGLVAALLARSAARRFFGPIALALALPGAPVAAALELTLSAQPSAVEAGRSLTVIATYAPGHLAGRPVDVWAGARVPGGDVVAFGVLRAGLTAPASVAVGATLAPSTPTGAYTLFVAAVRAGRALSPASALAVATAALTVTPPGQPHILLLPGYAQDHVDGLFMAHGPRHHPPNPATWAAYWKAYPRGSRVRVVLGSGTSATVEALLRRAAGDVNARLGHWLTVTVERSADARPAWEPLTIAFVEDGDPPSFPTEDPAYGGAEFPRWGRYLASGGTRPFWDPATGEARGAYTVQLPGGAPCGYVHDAVGHGLFVADHLSAVALGGTGESVMAFWSAGEHPLSTAPPPGCFSGDDWLAIEAVYAGCVAPGDPREAFAACGLVRP